MKTCDKCQSTLTRIDPSPGTARFQGSFFGRWLSVLSWVFLPFLLLNLLWSEYQKLWVVLTIVGCVAAALLVWFQIVKGQKVLNTYKCVKCSRYVSRWELPGTDH